MPFKSKAQQGFMFAAEKRGDIKPGTAERWAKHTKDMPKLPEYVKHAEGGFVFEPFKPAVPKPLAHGGEVGDTAIGGHIGWPYEEGHPPTKLAHGGMTCDHMAHGGAAMTHASGCKMAEGGVVDGDTRMEVLDHIAGLMDELEAKGLVGEVEIESKDHDMQEKAEGSESDEDMLRRLAQ